MSFTVVPYTTRQEWLDLRRTGIGASDIAAVLGVSPWSTPRQVWIQKTTPEAPEAMTNEDMEWGLRMEGLILAEAEDRLGLDFVPQLLVRSDERPWMMATVDGITDGAVLEVKKVDDWSWDEIPDHYMMQVQWQLAVTGYDKGWIAALHRGRRLELYPVLRDEEVIAGLVEAGERFWLLVEQVEPPPVSADDSEYLGWLWPDSVEEAVEIVEALADELVAAKRDADAAESRFEEVKARVKDAMGKADTAVVGQRVAVTWKTSPNNRVDVKMLRAEEPDIAATYTKKGTSRRFLVKESKT